LTSDLFLSLSLDFFVCWVAFFFLALSDISIEHWKNCDGDDDAARVIQSYLYINIYVYDMQNELNERTWSAYGRVYRKRIRVVKGRAKREQSWFLFLLLLLPFFCCVIHTPCRLCLVKQQKMMMNNYLNIWPIINLKYREKENALL
jgi:hypothetical protein